MPLSKIRKYVLRMVVVLLTFGYAYCLIETLVTNGLTNLPMSVLLSARNLIEGKSWAHMWYVYMLIGLYLLTPMLRIFVKHADAQTMRWTLAILFLLTVVRPTVMETSGLEIASLVPIASPYLFYYLMGRHFADNPWSRRMAWIATLAGGIGVAAMQIVASGGSVEMAPPDNFFTSLYAMGLFSLAQGSTVLEKAAESRVISSVSAYSFGIYLIHPFFLNLLNKGLHVTPSVLPIVFGELSFFIFALVCAWMSSWLLCRIPGLRKIIV